MTPGYEPGSGSVSDAGAHIGGAFDATLKKVLLVCDDPRTTGFLHDTLRRAGWTTFSAETVADAKGILKSHPHIQVMISNIQLPAESGFDLVRWLNDNRCDDQHIEVILITADASDDALIVALRSRVFDVLRKPFDLHNLVAAAERAYRTASARRDRFQRLAQLATALEQMKQERLVFQSQLRDAEARFEDTQARLTYAGQTMASIVSHELRTPLIPIIGLAQVLETSDELTADEIRELAGEIRQAGESLANIVDNALTFIDIDRQIRTQPHDRISMAELARDVVAELAQQTAFKRITMTVSCAAQVHVRAPRFLLRCALLALMDNAVKASPENGTVSMSVRPGDAVAIDIRDHGPGLCENVRKNFGAPFLHGDNSDTRTWPGIGLGIASALRIVEACGGGLELAMSEPGCGTVMRMTLPSADRDRTSG